MGSLGWPEIAVILLVVLLLFGAKKIPEFARGLGQGLREFKRATNEVVRELETAGDEVKQDVRKVEKAVTAEVVEETEEPAG